MRPVLHSDLSAAARALLAAPAALREEMIVDMVQEAENADRYTRRLGKPHPKSGNGTLTAVAQRHGLAGEPTIDNSEYCDCLRIVLSGLVARRMKHVQMR